MPEHRPATILFVDDDPANRRMLSWLLRDAGHLVLEASTGHEALELARQKPDLVILDVNLPDVSGFEVCRQLRAHPATRHVAVLHMSAVYVHSGDRLQGLEAGADAYLVKPVEARELLAHVRALLRIRAAEDASRRAAQEWRATFEAISDGVCLVDPRGVILRSNSALSGLLNVAMEQLIGQQLDEVLKQPGGFSSLRQGGDRQVREVQLGSRWFRILADPIRDETGGFTGSVYIITDITRRVELEEALRQSLRLEAVGRLAGGIAHEFNNLLTAIMGNTSLLLHQLPAGGTDHDLASTIQRAAWRAAELTRQLLGFSRQMLLWLRAVDPAEVINEVISQLRQLVPATIEVSVQQPDPLWVIQADPAPLIQALMSLCQNAIAAMPNGGRLVLKADNVDLNDDRVEEYADARNGSFVRISVHDTAPALPADQVERIFDPFFTPIGTAASPGLGLAMVYGLAKQLQGWVEFHSQQGHGNRFELYLPRTTAAGTTPIPATAAAPAGLRRVLLLEDNTLLRNLAMAFLRHAGFQVFSAETGDQAVEIYQREHAQIDLVILAEGSSETIRQLRQINANVRVLLADSEPRVEELSLSQHRVSKPYRQRELLQAVQAALNLSQS